MVSTLVRKINGPHEVVPGAEKGEDAEGGQGGLGEGQKDAVIDLDEVAAVDARRLDQFLGNGEIELAHEEDAQRRCRRRTAR